jgi:hypothetical protein
VIINTVEQTAVIDYSKKYYLNTQVSIFGNGTVSAELNSDGTLSKTSSATTPGATEALSTLLPIKEFLSAAAGLAAPVGGFREGGLPLLGKKVQFTLSLEKVGNVYEFTDITDVKPTTPKCALTRILVDFNTDDSYKDKQFTVKPLGGAKEENKPNTIKISGDVTLPTTTPGK